MKLIKVLLLILLPFSLFSQSEGGFGFRRFSNTTTLNATSVSNSNTSASRNGYVHSNGLYYVWDGNSWEREEDIDTLSLSGNILSISLYGDGVPAKTVDLSTNLYCDAVVSPPSFSTSQDNYNPTGLSSACELRLTTTAQVNLTGIVAQPDGYELILTNEGNHPITLSDNVTSTAANRFLFGYNYNLAPSKSVRIRYDGTASRWRISDSGSLGTGSGRIVGGRSQDVYWSYQTDTLKDFAIGYFTDGTTDDRINYGKFGVHMDGTAGFSIAGKETYIKGSLFNLLGTSYITANGYGYEMSGLSRVSSGSSSNTRVQLTGNTIFDQTFSTIFSENELTIDDVNDLYDELAFGTMKQLNGVPKNRTDYGYLYQGGGHTGADTSAISVWWGVPQNTDTVNSISTGGVRAISKERGFGVQSIFNHVSGIKESFKYDWFKIKTGSVPADTAVHSSSNDGITFYGNSYELPNQVPSSVAGDTSIIVWTSPFNSMFLDIDDVKSAGRVPDSTFVKTDGSYLNKRITSNVARGGTTSFQGLGGVLTDTTGLINISQGLSATKYGVNWKGNQQLVAKVDADTRGDSISDFLITRFFADTFSLAGDNQVFSLGWNIDPGGGRSNTTRAGAAIRFEEKYTYSVSNPAPFYELHLPDIQFKNGVGGRRPLSGLFGHNASSGGDWTFESDYMTFHDYKTGSNKAQWTFGEVSGKSKGIVFIDTARIYFEHQLSNSGISFRDSADTQFIKALDITSSNEIFIGGQNTTTTKFGTKYLKLASVPVIYSIDESVISIGDGTRNNAVHIHAPSEDVLTLRSTLETTGWTVRVESSAFALRNPSGNSPFYIHESAPHVSEYIANNGDVGFGTSSVDGKVHLYTTSGETKKMLKMENSTGSSVQHRGTSNPNTVVTGSPSDLFFRDSSSVGKWYGKQTGVSSNTGWVEFYHTGNLVNIFNSDGTQDDADRYFTQDSTRTFAMGQFTSVGTPTWGRGYYYDPSTSNGIRLLNKNGANTTTAIIELDPETINATTTHTTSSVTTSQFSLSESSQFITTVDRTSDTHGSLIVTAVTNSNEETVTMTQNGKGTAVTASVYLGTGYSSSQYNKYSSRAFGVQSLLTNGGFDWIQVLLPNTATDSTGNNISFYNRKYYWSNETPSFTSQDTMVHVWIGNGTNATPDFVEIASIVANAKNLYNSNGTTTQNTRTSNILESIQWVGSADLGVDPYPFQIHSTGNEPLIQLWKGNTDSVWLYQSDVEYHFGSSAHLVVESTDQLTFQTTAANGTITLSADGTLLMSSDSINATTIESKTTIRNILGQTSGNIIKKFDGDAASSGDILVSDGSNWKVGSLSANESNAQSTIRPSQLTAKQDNWNPTGYSTTKTQIIELSGDGSFRFITGMTAATRDGVIKTLENEGTTNCVGIAKNHTDSDAANRFDMNKDVVLLPQMSATFRYDSIGTRWKLVHTSEASTSFGPMYKIIATNQGTIISDTYFYDGQAAGGTITRSSGGSITDGKIATTNFSTSTAATASPCLLSYVNPTILTANNVYIRTYTRVRFEDLSTASEDYDFTFGYGEYSGIDTLARTKEGFFITYTHSENSGAFSLWTHNGTSGTSAQMGSAIAADTWYELELIYYPYGEVTAYINGTRYTTTTTVPTTANLAYMWMMDKDNGTTARLAYTTSLEDTIIHVAE